MNVKNDNGRRHSPRVSSMSLMSSVVGVADENEVNGVRWQSGGMLIASPLGKILRIRSLGNVRVPASLQGSIPLQVIRKWSLTV